MGRAPCCDKANVKKGPWSPEEDAKLKSYIDEHGTGGNWIALPQKIGLKRCGKSCRLRWLNYLRPNIKHGGFSEEEDNIICSLFLSIGSRWSIIAAQLPGRTDNDIKNYWNTKLKKKLMGKQRKEQQARSSSLQQEMKREISCSEAFMVSSEVINSVPHWPELPVNMLAMNNPSSEDYFKDQTSIRKLLVSIGGRFHDDDHHEPNNNSTNFQYPFDNSINTFASTASINSMNSSCSQQPDMFEGFNNNYPIELASNELVYNSPQQLDVLESFSGVDMVNGSGSGIISSAESTKWGEMISSLVYPPMVASNYEAFQKRVIQDCNFQESRYFGLQ
ncbi:unnamed protein product [Camellia sinensis]